ncbi:unnamed protein product, partial [Pleuronectes platessa]
RSLNSSSLERESSSVPPHYCPRTSRPLRCRNARANPALRGGENIPTTCGCGSGSRRKAPGRWEGSGAERKLQPDIVLVNPRLCVASLRSNLIPESGAFIPGGVRALHADQPSQHASRRPLIALPCYSPEAQEEEEEEGKNDHPLTDSAILDFCLRVTWSAPASIRGGVRLVEGR